MIHVRQSVAIAAFCLLFAVGTNRVSAQTASQWYPTQNPGITVASVWYLPVLNQLGIPPHIGVETASRASYFYYFSPTDANQLAVANAIYASLLSAEISGQPVFLYMSGTDRYTSGVWDFAAVQVGNNP
jgi:hypothetical protein